LVFPLFFSLLIWDSRLKNALSSLEKQLLFFLFMPALFSVKMGELAPFSSEAHD